jgi:hypothetical protein
MDSDKSLLAEDPGQGYDTEKYVSRDEYLRDVAALKNKWTKALVYIGVGAAIGSFNIWLIRFMEVDHQFDWLLVQPGASSFAMDQIMAWVAAIFVLLIPGTWIGIAKHRIYAFAYFSGFSAAGIAFMAVPEYLVPGLYVFSVSFLLLVVLYLIFYKIWTGLKRSVARIQTT